MILSFHIICIWAHYIVSNLLKTLKKVLNEKEHDGFQLPEFLIIKNDNMKLPFYEDGTLKFSPPIYIQRYQTVTFVLQDYASKQNVRKVVDFGCAELSFFMYLKNIPGLTEILEVDIDSKILEKYSFKAAPLTIDHLMGIRSNPLDVYILAGNVADYDDHLINSDIVIGIELIEHLNVEDLVKMPSIVFHKIKPKLAIFTTPNADFNSLFPNFKDFRHKDHKFEWTRKEFFNWAQEILKFYPEYSVRFYGIGVGPEGSENLGCCTQMAVFQRSKSAELFLNVKEKNEGIHTYKLIEHYEYPFYVDRRTNEEKILHEIQYQVPHLSNLDAFYNYDNNESEIPLDLLKEYVSDLCSDDKKLLDILAKNGMVIRKKNSSWFLVLTDVESDLSEMSIKCDDWLNEDVLENFCDNDDNFFDKEWTDEELVPIHMQSVTEFQSSWSLKESELEFTDSKDSFCKEQDCLILPRNKKKFISLSCSHLDNFSVLCTCQEVKKMRPIKNRIPFKRCNIDTNSSVFVRGNSKFLKKIFKSYSLDSCLEDINCKCSEQEFCYFNLKPEGYSTFSNWLSQKHNLFEQFFFKY